MVKGKATMVSCIGDDDLKRALAVLADERGTTVAALVREAIDEKYGSELKKIRRFFNQRRTRMYKDEPCSSNKE